MVEVVADFPVDAQAAEPVQEGEGAFDDPAVNTEAGAVVFTAGPFEDKSQVDALVAALKAAGVENISVTESASE